MAYGTHEDDFESVSIAILHLPTFSPFAEILTSGF